jgi:putative nucleotide binding protein
MTDSERSDDAADGDVTTAVVLDYLAHGRADDDRPQYQKEPLAYAVGDEEFRLYELELAADADVNIGSRVPISESAETPVTNVRTVDYDDLSSGARSELEYAVEDIAESDQDRFVGFYNEAQPITTRLHALNLLPGIGKKLRNNILDERKREPFESFEEIESRVSGLHNPRQVLVERILEEIREEDLKYRTFARREED